MKKVTINIETGEEAIEDLIGDELVENQQLIKAYQENYLRETELEAINAANKSLLLKKLGINEDEAKLLLS